MRISKFRLAVAGVCGALLFTGIGAGTAVALQPHMTAARGDLQAAHSELEQAIPDKDGHRVNAMNLIDQAIAEVNLGIAAGS
ncbi:hypothetical protein [Nocardia sp. alder85J]|uniref:hypothetical protein n=1 Tax=Nocardia sp. alder85J TaxID=2862949 RepID=UPI001CD2548E|nr:hypothetical protein [Nocardia sp. alder85J]MCX4092109.1 hypothetical protein [Nocardia sp. alder85J]